ncbi:alpha/beta hydrolase-fold protein [Frankia sp. R82]|uniref:alpha/beta hydrolase-fold protein n=1 Tax=Frankia sp. R82 TaxID=2950553 RepID=UPI00204358CD|nr:alpha/beta hydrolase-fold protein [Frankia sp. R82]MCM3882562.1 esterase family protein [Frankia sp. R82]
MRPSRRTLLITVPAVTAGAALANVGGTGCAASTSTTPGISSAAGPGPTASAGAAAPASASGSASPQQRRAAQAASGPAVVTATSFRSAARGRQVSMVVVAPAGGARDLPVCLVLHGRGDDARGSVGLLGLDALLPGVIRAGVPPFALVTLDGGTTYWHRRASGDDPETMILEEVRPRLAAAGIRTTRLAAWGWSMGGYGALLLARRHPDLVVAAAASSPAMWHTYGASAPGAFDSAADFAAHRVLGTGPAPGVAYRVDCGSSDPFAAVSREAVTQLQPAEHSLGAGSHNPTYWRSVAPAQLAFVGTVLART